MNSEKRPDVEKTQRTDEAVPTDPMGDPLIEAMLKNPKGGSYSPPAKLEAVSEPPTAALDLLDLASWLEIESEELMKEAMGREGYAKCDENLLSEGDERKAHKIAEQMAGRKLPHQSAEELRRNASIQRKIAAKCEAEAKQLSRWADTVRAEAARASQPAALRKVAQSLIDDARAMGAQPLTILPDVVIKKSLIDELKAALAAPATEGEK